MWKGNSAVTTPQVCSPLSLFFLPFLQCHSIFLSGKYALQVPQPASWFLESPMGTMYQYLKLLPACLPASSGKPVYLQVTDVCNNIDESQKHAE